MRDAMDVLLARSAGENAQECHEVPIVGIDAIVVEVDIASDGEGASAACEEIQELSDVAIIGEDVVTVHVDGVADRDGAEVVGWALQANNVAVGTQFEAGDGVVGIASVDGEVVEVLEVDLIFARAVALDVDFEEAVVLAAAEQLRAVPLFGLALIGAPAVEGVGDKHAAAEGVVAPVGDAAIDGAGSVFDAAEAVASCANVPEVNAVAVAVEIEVAHFADFTVSAEDACDFVLLHEWGVDAHGFAALRAGDAGAVNAAAEGCVVPLDEDDLSGGAGSGEFLHGPVPLGGADVEVRNIAELVGVEPRAVGVEELGESGAGELVGRWADVVVCVHGSDAAEGDDGDGAVVGAEVEVLELWLAVGGGVPVCAPLVTGVLHVGVDAGLIAAAVEDAVVADGCDDGTCAEQIVILTGVVAPEFVPAALLFVGGTFDEIARHDDHVWVTQFDLLDVLLVAQRLGEQVLITAATCACGPTCAAWQLRRAAAPLAIASAAADECFAVAQNGEADAASSGRGWGGAEGVGVG